MCMIIIVFRVGGVGRHKRLVAPSVLLTCMVADGFV